MYAGFLALARAPVLTVAAVDGATIGAGVNLPLACDVVFASPTARFDPRFLDLGLPSPSGSPTFAAASVAERDHRLSTGAPRSATAPRDLSI